MKFLKNILFFTAFLCFTTLVKAQYINIDDTKTATDLVNILTNNSSCVAVANATTKGDTFSPNKNSYGDFNAGTSSFPFTNGIILSTWSSIYSKGPFVREPSTSPNSGSSNWKGDIDLENALKITNTINATALEFDFTPQTNTISFNYIFASNEYQDNFPCSHSDGFAFLIKENIPGAQYQNLAVLPDGTPVSSKTVHPAFSFNSTKCDPINETYFEQLNTSPTNNSPIDYSGQTKILTAQTTVKVGASYHIKLVIADQSGNFYDSAVFLQAGSFSSTIDLGKDQLLATNNAICFGDSYTINTGVSGIGYTYKWFKNNAEILDSNNLSINTNSYTAKTAGDYRVEVTIPGGCKATGKIKIEFLPKIQLNDVTLTKCDDTGNGTATFDLTKAETTIKNNDPSLTKIDYYETQTGSVLSNIISKPSAFTKTILTDVTVFAKLTSSTHGCTETAKITLKTIKSKQSSTASITPPIVKDFSGNTNSIQFIPPSSGTYEFSLDGINYQVSPLFSNLAVGNYTAYIRDSSNCEYLTYPITILDYPRFFTPNNDGFNDVWEIKSLNLFPQAILTIYDRYGKLLKELNSTHPNWNGIFNGYELPSDDYWFVLNFGDGKTIKGHFSLKR